MTIPDNWQTDPGRLRGLDKNAVGKYEYIAFSAAHIASKSNGIKLGNTSFRILKLRASLLWQTCVDLPDEEMLVCTVIGGVVQVILAGQAFNVAKGGMWKIKGGENCKIRCGGDGGEAELQLVHLAYG